MPEETTWHCSCGTENEGKFCTNCGKPRPGSEEAAPVGHDGVTDDTLSMPPVQPPELAMDQTQMMPPVQPLNEQPLPPQPPMQQPPRPMMQPSQQQNNNNMIKILVGVLIALLVAGIGFFAYVNTAEDRYVAKCQEGQQVVADVQSLMQEVKGLSGDPDADETKDFLDRMDKGSKNLDKLANDLRSTRTGSKYQAANQRLVDSLDREKAILDNAHKVVKEPLGKDTAGAIKQVRQDVQELTNGAADIAIEGTDFPTAFQLSDLGDNLQGYVQKKVALDQKKAEEEARKRAEAQRAKQQAILQRENSHNQDIMNTSTDVEWLATSVTRVSGGRMNLTGFFYNGTGDPVIRVDSMVLHITLYKDGNQIYESDFNFNGTLYAGRMSPHSRQSGSSDLFVTDSSGNIPQDFDEYRVTSGGVHWTYTYR